jgi:hypothetical protein
MRETTKINLIIRYLDDDGEYVYLESFNINDRRNIVVYECYSLEDAKNLEGLAEEQILAVFEAFQKEHKHKNCEFVTITTTEKVDEFLEDDDRLKEIRKMSGIAKLTESEIKALDLVNTAVYIKTKYHNA